MYPKEYSPKKWGNLEHGSLDLGNKISRMIDDILDVPQVVTLCGRELTIKVEKKP
jgi:hypothetical protein